MSNLQQNADITAEVSCGVTAGDLVLIIAIDRVKAPYGDPLGPVAEALAAACRRLRAVPTIMSIQECLDGDSLKQGADLADISAAIAQADVVINTADSISFHRLSGGDLPASGGDTPGFVKNASGEQRWFVLQGHKMDEWALDRHQVAMTARRARWMSELVGRAGRLRVTSPAGTDISFDISGGALALPYLWLVPLYGETAIVPHAVNGEGVMVVDGSTQMGVRPPSELARTPLTIEIANGRVADCRGDEEQVARLERFIEAGDPRADQVDEIGIVTSTVQENSSCWWEDGTHHVNQIHIALGNNELRRERVHGPSHMDCEIVAPTVTIDDLPVVRAGAFADRLMGAKH